MTSHERPALPPDVRRLLKLSVLAGLVASALALLWLGLTGTRLGLHLVAAVCLAITGSLALAGGLMGLLFASSRSGYDEEAGRPD